MRVHVVDRLAGLRPGVEHHPVAGLGNACVACHQRRLSRDLAKQAVVGLGERGQILMVLFRYHQNVHRRLGVYVLK